MLKTQKSQVIEKADRKKAKKKGLDNPLSRLPERSVSAPSCQVMMWYEADITNRLSQAGQIAEAITAAIIRFSSGGTFQEAAGCAWGQLWGCSAV